MKESKGLFFDDISEELTAVRSFPPDAWKHTDWEVFSFIFATGAGVIEC